MFPKDQFCDRDDTDLESKRPQLVTSVYKVLLTSYFYFSSKCSLSNIHKTRGHLFRYQVILRKRKFSTNFPIWWFSFKERVIFIASAFNWFKRNQQSDLITKYSYAPLNGRNTFWERSLGSSVLLTSQSALPKPSGTAYCTPRPYELPPSYLQSGVDWDVTMWVHNCIANNKSQPESI